MRERETERIREEEGGRREDARDGGREVRRQGRRNTSKMCKNWPISLAIGVSASHVLSRQIPKLHPERSSKRLTDLYLPTQNTGCGLPLRRGSRIPAGLSGEYTAAPVVRRGRAAASGDY